MKIYKPSIKYFETPELTLLKEGKKLELSEEEFPYCSSTENALQMLKENLELLDPACQIVSITITVSQLNSTEYWDLNFYDKSLNYIGQYSYEPNYSNPKYDKNDWVLFTYSNKIVCGLIVESAINTEPYLIIYEDMELNDCSPHHHVDEFFIVEKITEESAKNLLPRKYFELIKLRSKKYK